MSLLTQWVAPALWLSGLALLMAWASYRRYEPGALRGRWPEAALALVAVGALGSAGTGWERLGWAAVLALLVMTLFQARRGAP